MQRVVKRDGAFAKESRIKIKTLGKESISINKENIDLRLVEQLVDQEQLTALGLMIKSMKLHYFDGKRTLQEAVEVFYEKAQREGFEAFCQGDVPGNLILPRKQELYAALNRCRGLLKVEN